MRVTPFGGRLEPAEDQFKVLRSLIEECEDLYPGIGIWYRKKVLDGFKAKERIAYVIYVDSKPVGAIVVRLGRDAKICSLRIRPEAEKNGLGTLLIALAARDMRNVALNAHFTIPAHIWDEKKAFFESYGFQFQGTASHQYRLFDEEFVCRARFQDIWLGMRRRLPSVARSISINGLRSDYDLVMSINPAFATSIVEGKKKVEVRRRFSEKWIGSRALVYATKPEGSFIGSFRITNVLEGEPDEIWKTFGPELGCSQQDFFDYTRNTNRVYAIVVGDSTAFKAPIPLTQINRLIANEIEMPQAYKKVHKESVLDEAASICTILQSTL